MGQVNSPLISALSTTTLPTQSLSRTVLPSFVVTPEPVGECAVCGVQTTQRCSSCAEYGFDLFLCGREHQKLVWFVHKRVCGEKSRSFSFPPLTPAEVEEALRLKDDRGEAGHESIVDECARPGVPSSEVPDFLRALGTEEGASEDPRDSSRATVVIRRSLLRLEQGRVFGLKQGKVLLDGKAVKLEDRWWITSAATSRAAIRLRRTARIESLLTPTDETSDLFSPFYHQVLIHAAIALRTRSGPRPAPGEVPPLYQFQQISTMRLKQIAKEVRKQDDEAGAALEYAIQDLPTIVSG